MIGATKSPSPGCELAATASLAMPQPQRAASLVALLDGTVSGSPPEAPGRAERPRSGRAAGPGAAQTRQIAHWTREGVALII